MKSYVISLKFQSARRQHIIKQFNNLNIEFEFFDAIDKDQAIDVCESMQLKYQKNAITLGELA